jgi:hypothetical protein
VWLWLAVLDTGRTQRTASVQKRKIAISRYGTRFYIWSQIQGSSILRSFQRTHCADDTLRRLFRLRIAHPSPRSRKGGVRRGRASETQTLSNSSLDGRGNDDSRLRTCIFESNCGPTLSGVGRLGNLVWLAKVGHNAVHNHLFWRSSTITSRRLLRILWMGHCDQRCGRPSNDVVSLAALRVADTSPHESCPKKISIASLDCHRIDARR